MFDAYLFLGIVHNGRGNAYLAMDYLTQAIDIAIKPADVSMAHTHRGLTYATLKRYDESFADLETALNLDPSNDLANWVHGVVSKQIAEEEAAEAEQGTEPGVGLGLNP
jgi:tetratricopeptide (TPR) repeat protein